MQLQSTVLAEIKMPQFRKPQLAEINITAKEHISYFLHFFTLIENTEYEHAGQFGGEEEKVLFFGGEGRRSPSSCGEDLFLWY